MTATIKWSNKALKQAAKLGQPAARQISMAVSAELPDFRSSKNVKKLTNHQYPYRLRVGDYRVFFSEGLGEDAERRVVVIVRIEEVKKRDERTY